ncbi:MAG: hypothetical protein IT562_18315 [Alphaproteobacteria bacterium]|nr:hypothetical protein [Alphaproteobacteria bacterium]
MPEAPMPLRDRDGLMALLNRLGSPEDAVALAAAREIDARVKRDGIGWEALLVRYIAGDAEDDAPGHVHASPDDDAASASAGADTAAGDAPIGDPATDLAAIERLLSTKDLSADTQKMLGDLKEDIQAGAFAEADRRYVRSLEIRLAAAKRK